MSTETKRTQADETAVIGRVLELMRAQEQPRGRTAEIDDLAMRLLVAAFGAPEDGDTRTPKQWAGDLVPISFDIAEAFFAESDRRRS